MSEGISSSVAIVAYLALFSGVSVVFLFANLLIGRFVRPANPHEEKLEIYECGEPTIGSSFVQFDLRFYVVALLFIIFDVEVAFFFPWATVFGKSTHLGREEMVVAERVEGSPKLTADAQALYRELGIQRPTVVTTIPASLEGEVVASTDPVTQANAVAKAGARQLALVSIVDILVFFAVLMIGFLYVWYRGDLDWVRAVGRERAAQRGLDLPTDEIGTEEPVLSA
jgi:NADH-quinone oxidoreductase subunit A